MIFKLGTQKVYILLKFFPYQHYNLAKEKNTGKTPFFVEEKHLF